MSVRTHLFRWTSLLIAALAAGCSGGNQSSAPSPTSADEEGLVRGRFAELQAAVKEGDSDKLWELLDSRGRADAEREARAVQAAYAGAGAEEKAKLEEATGLSGAELAGLTGKGVLKAKRFKGKYHELPESTIEKVTIQGDSATVHYLEPDEDKEKLILVRQDGRWKVWLTIPKVIKPD